MLGTAQSLLRSTRKLLEYTHVSKALVRKSTALLLLIGLMVPMWLAKPVMTVKASPAKPPTESPQPGSQPTPYIVGAGAKTQWSVTLATTLLNLVAPKETERATYHRPETVDYTNAAEFASYRLAPLNATGGTNLYSRNFGWGTNLVSLPGRAGLNLDIPISYNSLMWLKDDTSIVFDPDVDNVSPGF
ncbi:MAG: hypothetical protein JO314_01735, partial [Acidobacteria bacterium]|nr:hypothetical protein [Acidobacteriota bacterium]